MTRATEIVVTAAGRRVLLGAVRGHTAEVRAAFLERVLPEERPVLAAVLARIAADDDDRASRGTESAD